MALQDAQEEFPSGFDVVCGADVVYAIASIPSLFAAGAALLSASPQARLLLCHTARSVSEDVILQHANDAGLLALDLPAEAVQAAASLSISADSAMRLLCLGRRQS